MSDSLFSPSWYRVAALKPRIRAHTRILRQSFRGQVWFVLQDYAAERLRLLFVGITRARRELMVTWNTGRFGNCTAALPLLKLQQWWEGH